MSSIIESISKVRVLLGKPSPGSPTDDDIYEAVIRNVQGLYNKVANSGEAWAIGDKTLQVTPNEDIFTLSTEDSFGKILSVTTQSSDGNMIERSVPFFEVQNLPLDWNMPQNYAGRSGGGGGGEWYEFSSGSHSAERMAVFYDKNGSLKIQVRPKPAHTAEYKFRYSIGNWARKLSFEARPILSQFHDLFEIRSAMDTLYMCEWLTLDFKENIARRREIQPYLEYQEARYLPDFEKYIKKMTRAEIIFRDA